MYNQPKIQNAIAAIRVSSVKQGTEGDSPEAQKEQIERWIENRGIRIKKYFVFLESASKEQQPMQEAIDYCKNPKHRINLFVVKSIDRFTRGGSYSYSNLKMQLEKCNVRLTDIYGVIGSHKVNTLEHLGLSYKWSVYDPTKNSEILEAERASDEKRDIMSRMIGAQIRYARMGYWMRRPPMGLTSEVVETYNGKRCVLTPNPIESRWIIKIFELRAKGTLSDEQIVESVNNIGYKSRTDLVRSKINKRQVIAHKGGNVLDLKSMRRYIQNPVYAGVICEKWTLYQPVRGKFDKLVSIELFNKANRGLISIRKNGADIKITRHRDQLIAPAVNTNALYPYKKVVLCPHCEKALYGSASRGKSGKYYPAYHCNKRGHYIRINKAEFDETMAQFIPCVKVAPQFIDQISSAVTVEWKRRKQELKRDDVVKELRVSDLEREAKQIIGSLRFLNNASSIRRMEEELDEVETQIKAMKVKEASTDNKQFNESEFIALRTKLLLTNLKDWLVNDCDPATRGTRFGVLFDKAPTYTNLTEAVLEGKKISRLSEIFIQDN